MSERLTLPEFCYNKKPMKAQYLKYWPISVTDRLTAVNYPERITKYIIAAEPKRCVIYRNTVSRYLPEYQSLLYFKIAL